MTEPSDLPALYSTHPIVVWVEDEETKTYLATIWDDSDIKFLIAGGHANIDAIVKSASADGISHVFGVRDRDFSTSNRARWSTDQALRVFSIEAFEIENLLLDAIAMAECDVNKADLDAEAIQAELDAIAAPLAWWMSCRKTIVHFRDTATMNSIEHPKRSAVTTKLMALGKIIDSAWWTTTFPSLGAAITPAEAERLLDAHHREYSSALNDGTWIHCFAGKEILGEIRSRLWTRDHESGLGGKVRLVRAIAKSQRELTRAPQEIQDLRAALRERVGLGT